MNAVGKLGEKEIVLKAGNFNGHIRSNPKKTMKTSMEVMVMEIGTRKGKDSGDLCSHEHDSMEHTLQE